MNKNEKYELLLKQLESLIIKGIPAEGNICNILAHLKSELDLFWVGIYTRINEDTLGLSCFQGLPACTLIKFGKGVCGTAAATAETQIVDDVSKFPGYIACHAEASSEIVVPGFRDGKVQFVLDVDSIYTAAFDEDDKVFLEKVVKMIESIIAKFEPRRARRRQLPIAN